MAGAPPPQPMAAANVYRQGGMQQPQPPQQSGSSNSGGQQQKHDIFVGNLAFSTTEEQLHQAFSEIGRIVKVRMVNDLETGKPRGFAFIEFEDPQAALSAIRNMNDYELNGRRIRVNFSNSSHLETLAGRLGMDLSQTHSNQNQNNNSGGNNANQSKNSQNGMTGTNAVAEALRSLSKGEMYDVISQLKTIADKDPDEARKLLCAHPQLPEAVLHLMSKLDMIKTPLDATTNPSLVAATATTTTAPPSSSTGVNPTSHPPPPPKSVMQQQSVMQQHQQQQSAVQQQQQQQSQPVSVPPPPPTDPRLAAVDPRRRASDPRAARDPRMQQPPPVMPPVAPPPPPPMRANVPQLMNLDPTLVQQVMSLTPQQIGMLPVDKQQHILALRNQITGGMG